MRMLLVEDTEDVAHAIVESFSQQGHAVDHALNFRAAEDALAVQKYDVVVLDINLPDGSGIEILRAMRAAKNPAPVLMLTARLEVEDRIEALDIGADDYLMKPFDLRELEARVRALIRRRSDERAGLIEYGDLSFDPSSRMTQSRGAELTLTRREAALLEILLNNRGRVMPKERIFERMFAFGEEDVGVNAIEVYVARLRKKLEGGEVAIRTLRGLGYQLTLNENA